MKHATLLLVLVTVLGCPAHWIVKLDGNIVDPDGKPVDSCLLRILSADDEHEFAVLSVSGAFNRNKLVAPTARSYIFSITCEGYVDEFRSEPVVVTTSMERPYDLGIIVMHKSATP